MPPTMRLRIGFELRKRLEQFCDVVGGDAMPVSLTSMRTFSLPAANQPDFSLSVNFSALEMKLLNTCSSRRSLLSTMPIPGPFRGVNFSPLPPPRRGIFGCQSQQLRQIDRFDVDPEFACLDFWNIQHIVDQIQQMLTGAFDDGELLPCSSFSGPANAAAGCR